MPRSAAFQKAWDEVTQKVPKEKPSNEEKLDMYAYGKIADKEDINTATKPGMFDMVGKAKRNRWQKYVDEGVSSADAEKKYIQLSQDMVKKYA